MIFNFFRKKKSKFNNKKTIYKGIKFDSILECNCYKAIKKQCELMDLKLFLQMPYVLGIKTKYIADFVVKCPKTNKTLIIDAKGFETDVFKLKSDLMKKYHQKVHCVRNQSESIKLINKFFK